MIRDLDPNTDPPEIWTKFIGEENKNIKVNIEYTHYRWCEIIKAGMGKGFILCDDDTGEIKGWITCMKSPSLWSGEMRGFLTSFFIKPEYRGGFGYMSLINAFHAWAEKEGCVETVLTHIVNSQTERISHLYKSLGYTLFECDHVRKIKGA